MPSKQSLQRMLLDAKLMPTPAANPDPFPDFDSLPHLECEPYNEEPALDFRHGRRDVVQVQTRGASSHASQRSLLSSPSVFAASIAAKLRELGRLDLAKPIEHCHTERTHMRCTGCAKVSTFFNRCDLFYCPQCQPRLARERAQGVEFWTKKIAQPKHVVLTLTNTMSITTHHVRHIIKSFARLRRLKFARGWRGGFYRIEVTNEGKGWHLHLHALVDCDWIDARQLAIEWDKANRQTGHIVKVKDCRESNYLSEVTKYAVKGSMLAEWDATDIAQFIDAFTGVRTFGVFGSLYGLRSEWREFLDTLADKRQQCTCGCDTFRFLSDNDLEWEQCIAGGRPPPVPACAVIPAHPEFAFV